MDINFTSVNNLSLITGMGCLASPLAVSSRAPVRTAPNLVYVLENDRISAVITELIVKKNLAGGEVRCYPNGQQALAALTAATQAGTGLPDLVLLDLDMPLMDGWEFLDALADLPAAIGVCVFVLTSSIHPGDFAKAFGYGEVKGFFTKPLDDDSVVRMQVLLQDIRERALLLAASPISRALVAVDCASALPLAQHKGQRNCA